MKKTYYNTSQTGNLVDTILMQMHRDNWKPDYVVGLTRGGLMPALYISHYLNIPMETLKVNLRDHTQGPESNLWMAEDAFGSGGYFNDIPIYDEYKQKKILIVDDINDTGATLNWIIEDWKSGCLPDNPRWDNIWGNTVRFAVLVDNLSSEFTNKINYSAVEINKANEDEWIVFPWERDS